MTSWKSGILNQGAMSLIFYFLDPVEKPACSIPAGTEALREGRGRDLPCGSSDAQLHSTRQEFRHQKSSIQGVAASLFVQSTFSPYLVLEHVCACSQNCSLLGPSLQQCTECIRCSSCIFFFLFNCLGEDKNHIEEM